MDASIKHYEEIEKRIKTYYPECSITQLGDKMIVEMPMGKLEVRGYRVSFTAFGEPFGELDFENENELYEGIESYIVAMGNEVEKCNLAFITALKNAEKRCRITLRAGMAAFLLLLLGYYLFDLSMIVLLIGLLMPIAATVSLRFVRLHSFRRDWVCPHCGAKLPLTAKEWIPQMKSVAHCPVCGKELLDHALMEQRKLEVLSENDEEVQNGEAHEENRHEKTIARQTELLKPSGRRSCKIFGAMVLIFALFFGALMFVDIDQADPVITAVNAIALLLTAAAGVVLMRCDNTEQGNPEISNISVREQKWLSGVGISIGLFGMVLLFVSFVESTVTPVPFGTVMLFTVLGLFFIALSVWMLLARKNRSLLIYNTMMLGFVLTFGGSLVISGPVEHYPAVFVERHEPTEEQKDSDRTLTILLDDGTTAELNVSKHLYDLEEAGVEFVVCQKENFLGIRMVRMHLPERTDTSTLPEVGETTS